MTARRTNLALLGLLLLALVTGGLAFSAGTRWGLAPVVAHGVAGVALVALAPWKTAVARRGLARRDAGATWPSLALGLLVAVAVVTGVLRSAGLVTTYGPLDDMQVHVGAALAAVPLAAWHVAARPVRPRRRDLSRRNLLRAGVLLGTATTVYAALEGVVRLVDLPGARRRFTGSHEVGSHEPGRMPVTQWLDDDVPAIDPGTWTLELTGQQATRSIGYAELVRHRDRVTATLDCTGGWYAEQEWEGARLDRLVPDDPGARSIVVVSGTGYTRRFPIRDVGHLLLATRVGGRALSPGHGFPARLVAPGRRGFWWVKWVTRIETSTAPWWAQPPFPLS